jgi:restriction system protein
MVAELLNLAAEDVAEIHQGNTTKLSYRLAWARHYLKRFDLLQNSERGFCLSGNCKTEGCRPWP